jgi:hypothetical protein
MIWQRWHSAKGLSMSKIVQSPAPRWPGTVTVSSPIGLKQFIEFSAAWEAGKAQTGDYSVYMHEVLPGILACVEKWDLGGDFPKAVTPDTFPAVPFKQSAALFAALLTAIWGDAQEAEEAPNA